MKNISRLKWVLVMFIFLFQGCVYLRHSKELLFLKSLADNEKEKEDYIKSQETGFEQLRADIENDRLKTGISKKDILARYFEPINCLSIEESSEKSSCLYRHPTKYFFTDKVYLYFDENEALARWEFKED
ncbi:MAG: hypothetical protein ABIA66_02005 [Candidatus Omnitrophota bacterium]